MLVTQTLSILGKMDLEWPEIVRDIMLIFDLNLFTIPVIRAECFLTPDDFTSWVLASTQCIAIAFVLWLPMTVMWLRILLTPRLLHHVRNRWREAKASRHSKARGGMLSFRRSGASAAARSSERTSSRDDVREELAAVEELKVVAADIEEARAAPQGVSPPPSPPPGQPAPCWQPAGQEEASEGAAGEGANVRACKALELPYGGATMSPGREAPSSSREGSSKLLDKPARARQLEPSQDQGHDQGASTHTLDEASSREELHGGEQELRQETESEQSRRPLASGRYQRPTRAPPLATSRLKRFSAGRPSARPSAGEIDEIKEEIKFSAELDRRQAPRAVSSRSTDPARMARLQSYRDTIRKQAPAASSEVANMLSVRKQHTLATSALGAIDELAPAASEAFGAHPAMCAMAPAFVSTKSAAELAPAVAQGSDHLTYAMQLYLASADSEQAVEALEVAAECQLSSTSEALQRRPSIPSPHESAATPPQPVRQGSTTEGSSKMARAAPHSYFLRFGRATASMDAQTVLESIRADTDQLSALLFVCIFVYAARSAIGILLMLRLRGFSSGAALGLFSIGVMLSTLGYWSWCLTE